METKSDELEQNVGVIWHIVIVERRRLVGYDCSVLCCEVGEVFGANCRLDKDDDAMFCVEDIVEAIYIDEYGAGILFLGGIEDESVWTRTEIW